MIMNEITRLSVAQLSDLIKSKEVSPVEVTRSYIDRISKDNQKVNAFVTLTVNEALASAREAEAEIQQGNYKGSLHGVPIAHKDLYLTMGVRTTGGSRVHENFVPHTDATVVARYRDVGAVMLGKLNMHEFAYGPTNENSMFGSVGNPWDLARISGGSSGGSGVAVALGLCAAATGSDTGGSIRIPSACCGVVGLKPTYGRVSRYGVFPLCWTMDHPGPITRTVLDAALMLQPIAGYDPNDPTTVQRDVPDYRAVLTSDLNGLRIGIPTKYFFDEADEEVDKMTRIAIQKLAEFGAKVEEVNIPQIEYSAGAALAIYLAEAAAYHDDQICKDGGLYTDQVRTFIELGNYVLAKDYLNAQRYRALLGQNMAEVFKRVDVLVTPTVPITATEIGQELITVRGMEQTVFSALLRNTEPFNLTGLPALTVSCGFSGEGLPIGMQIIGRPFEEATILRVGHLYQEATDWHRRSPDLDIE